MKRFLFGVAAVLALAGFGPVQAANIVFDFESEATNGGTLTTLTMVKSGVSVTLTRPGSTFGIQDLSSFGAPGFGSRSLTPFNDTNGGAFFANITPGVSAVSLDYADFGGDADHLVLEAYSGLNGTGTLLASASGDLPAGTPFGAVTLTTNGSSIGSIRFIGGSTDFPNSVYYDNLTLTTTAVTPEPASMTLLGLGVAGLAGYGWRKRKTAAAAA